MKRMLFVTANALLVVANVFAYFGLVAEAALLLSAACFLFVLIVR